VALISGTFSFWCAFSFPYGIAFASILLIVTGINKLNGKNIQLI